jgi:hypothetical protein
LLREASVHLPLGRVITAFSGGTFFNLFLPSSIGGDFLRSVDLSMHTQKPSQVVATVVLDRLSGYVGLVIIMLAALVVGYKHVVVQPGIMISMSALLAVLVFVIIILFNKTMYEKISRLLRWRYFGKAGGAMTRLHRELFYFSRHGKLVAANLGLSILLQAVSPVVFYLIGRALGVRVPAIFYFIFLPIIGAATMLPISIGGLGVRDALTIFFFSRVGVIRDLAFAMSLLLFFYILIYGFMGGLIYVCTVRHRRIQPRTPSAHSLSD